MPTWTNQPKNLAEFEKQTLSPTIFDKGLGFLLQEIGAYILQENSGKIILQESWNYKKPITFTNQSLNLADFSKQSKSSASFSNQPKS